MSVVLALLVQRTARLALAGLLVLLGSLVAAPAARAELSLQEIVGQLLIVGFDGTKPSDPGAMKAYRDLKAGRIGGVIFFSHNIRSKKQVRELTRFFNSAGAAQPPFLAVDEEGGLVDRLGGKPGFSQRYPSAARVSQMGLAGAQQTYRAMAADLQEAGLNLNFGPVLDVNVNPDNPVIGRMRRSYGSDALTVEQYATAFIKAHRARGILTSLKHWPGHGSSRTDTHKEFVDITKTWNRNLELQPFLTLIDEQLADMVMVGHIYHSEWGQKDNRPASLSSTAITRMLRGDLGYGGVIITDDLQMKGVGSASGRSFQKVIVQALQAGNDILLVGNVLVQQSDSADLVYRTVESAVSRGQLSRAALLEAYNRVVTLKTSLRPPAIGQSN